MLETDEPVAVAVRLGQLGLTEPLPHVGQHLLQLRQKMYLFYILQESPLLRTGRHQARYMIIICTFYYYDDTM